MPAEGCTTGGIGSDHVHTGAATEGPSTRGHAAACGGGDPPRPGQRSTDDRRDPDVDRSWGDQQLERHRRTGPEASSRVLPTSRSFDATSSKNATMNVAVNVLGVSIGPGYGGTITPGGRDRGDRRRDRLDPDRRDVRGRHGRVHGERAVRHQRRQLFAATIGDPLRLGQLHGHRRRVQRRRRERCRSAGERRRSP